MAKMEEYKDFMCKCADRECAERVQKDMAEWTASKANVSKNMKPSQEDLKRMTAVMKEMTDCTAKAMAADMKPKPPDDPPPPDDSTSGKDTNGVTSGGTDVASLPACADYRREIDKAGACSRY